MSTPPDWVHPAFFERAQGAAARADHKGSLSNSDGATYVATERGITLSLRVTNERGTPTVGMARYTGTADHAVAGVFETFCRIVEGLPLREAADHGAIHAMYELLGDPLQRPMAGILTPHSAGAAFSCCEKLIRSILAMRATKVGDVRTDNFWTPALSSTWRSEGDQRRIDMLRPLVEQFRAEHGLSEDQFWLEAIDKACRVIVGFGPAVDHSAKPALLLRFEVQIRQETGNRLEVFMAEAKDTNSIRRLIHTEDSAA